jgi:excisionase family DNA binding protein
MSPNKLTVRQAVDQLGVSPTLIYALCAARKIRHERHGLGRGKIVIPEDALDEYRRRRVVSVDEERTPPPLEHITLR